MGRNKLKKNRNQLRQLGYSNVDICKIREATRREAAKMEEEATEKAFLYMLAIPLNVLVDMWGDEAKNKAPEFIEEVMSLYESVQEGYVTDAQLAELLYDMAGVEITAEWLRR